VSAKRLARASRNVLADSPENHLARDVTVEPLLQNVS
jgi:hypothetical protein